MKQTAVEWLVEKFKNEVNSLQELKEVFKQAKAMEKEQIKDAYDYGFVDGGAMVVGENTTFRNEEEYYNETFKK